MYAMAMSHAKNFVFIQKMGLHIFCINAKFFIGRSPRGVVGEAVDSLAWRSRGKFCVV